MSAASENTGYFTVDNVKVQRFGDNCQVALDLAFTDAALKPNRQLFVTPYIINSNETKMKQMPTYVFSGRNMHYVYERTGKTMASGKTKYNIAREMRLDKKTDRVEYFESTRMEDWMMAYGTKVYVSVDTCGCGANLGTGNTPMQPLNLNPADKMLVMPYPIPLPLEDKIIKHEGRAKVQFEVDKFQLHDQVYTYTHRITKRKHVIDNRAQLKIIDDSLHYALNSPNVELAGMEICGYASPESPYDHNEYLAQNRAKAVLDYVKNHYNISDAICSYKAVPENWGDFRTQVLEAKDITERQRKDLLTLIDRPVHSPVDYDRKEDELINSPTYAQLYASKIHPDWFPELRYTQFVISTHLKPMTIEQLREVIKTEPELMSLSQIYAVATSYERNSDEFNYAMATALKHYPEDPIANLNAAAQAIDRKDYDKAEQYIQKAGNCDEAIVMQGIVETYRGNFDKARQCFSNAKNSVEAQRNLQLLK